MNQASYYLTLAPYADTLRTQLQTIFSVTACVKWVDYSVGDATFPIEDALTSCAVAYPFYVDDHRGFLLFPEGFGFGILQALLGVMPSKKRSFLFDYVHHVLIEAVFKPMPWFKATHPVDVRGIWVHPTFESFYTMGFVINSDYHTEVPVWCYMPREVDQ
jgi:hypothetical protein